MTGISQLFLRGFFLSIWPLKFFSFIDTQASSFSYQLSAFIDYIETLHIFLRLVSFISFSFFLSQITTAFSRFVISLLVGHFFHYTDSITISAISLLFQFLFILDNTTSAFRPGFFSQFCITSHFSIFHTQSVFDCIRIIGWICQLFTLPLIIFSFITISIYFSLLLHFSCFHFFACIVTDNTLPQGIIGWGRLLQFRHFSLA